MRVALLAYVLLATTCLLFPTPTSGLENVLGMAADIAGKLEDLAEALDVPNVQAAFESAGYIIEQRHPTEDVDDMVSVMQSFFQNMSDSVARVAAAIPDLWSEGPADSEPVYLAPWKDGQRLAPDLQYNYYFNKHISSTVGGSRLPLEVSNGADELENAERAITIFPRLDPVFAAELEANPNLRWQYFATIEGAFHNYPAYEWDRQLVGLYGNYDPRFRPWYTQASSGPKDVVVVLDTSSSMTGVKFQGAQSGASVLVDSLSTDDWVGFVSMGYWEAWEGPCYGENLAQVTPSLKRRLKTTIGHESPYGPTNFEAGMSMAGRMLANADRSGRSSGCEKFIVVFTDGWDADNKYYEGCGGGCDDSGNCDPPCPPDDVFSGNWAPANVDFTVFVFVFADYYRGAYQIPQSLACYSCTRGQCGTVYTLVAEDKKGIGYENYSNMRGKIRPFFDFLSKASTSGRQITTLPYIDSSGLGMVITVAQPVLGPNGNVIGVTGADASLAVIETLLRDRVWGTAYFFLVTVEGETIVHPRLKAAEDYAENPDFIDIINLEAFEDNDGNVIPAGFVDLRTRILSEPSGSAELNTSRALPKGDPRFDGESFVPYLALYTWKAVPNTEFVVCLVADVQDDLNYQSLNGDTGAAEPDELFYHRLDVYQNYSVFSVEQQALDIAVNSRYPQAYTSLVHSTVKVAPRGFCEPVSYTETEVETWEDVLARTTALNTWNITNNVTGECEDYGPGDEFEPGDRIFTHDVVNGARVTSLVEPIWKSAQTPNYVVWRYIATPAGVFRIFPGVPSNRDYDPVRRPWYNRALTYENTDVVSTPYMDAAGAGRVVTLAHTITVNNKVEAVVGIDVTYDDFSEVIESLLPECNSLTVRCMLVDRSGFLVYHPDFVVTTENCLYTHRFMCEADYRCEWLQDRLQPDDEYAGQCFDAFSHVSLGNKEGDLARTLFYELGLLQLTTFPEFAGFCPPGWQSDPDYLRIVDKTSRYRYASCRSGTTTGRSCRNSRGSSYYNNQDFDEDVNAFFEDPRMNADVDPDFLPQNDHGFNEEAPMIGEDLAHPRGLKQVVPVDQHIFRDWPIDPSPSNYECTKTRRVFTFDHSYWLQDPDGSLTGSFAGMCDSGDFEIVTVGDTNLYLLVIENYQRNELAFECGWVNNLVVSKSTPVDFNCRFDSRPVEEFPVCAVEYVDVPLNCNAANTSGASVLVTLVAFALALMTAME